METKWHSEEEGVNLESQGFSLWAFYCPHKEGKGSAVNKFLSSETVGGQLKTLKPCEHTGHPWESNRPCLSDLGSIALILIHKSLSHSTLGAEWAAVATHQVERSRKILVKSMLAKQGGCSLPRDQCHTPLQGRAGQSVITHLTPCENQL